MRLIIAGDFAPTDITMPLFEDGNIEELFGDVPELFQTADRVIINLECVLTTTNDAIPKIGPNIKAVPQCAEILSEIGVTDCAMSNNHVFDFGIKGLQDTIENLEKSGIIWTGVGKNDVDSRRPLVMNVDEKTISLIAVCEHEYSYALSDRMGANPYDPYTTMEDIRMAREKSDYVIVLYHGGKEYSYYPSPRLRKLCQAMVRNGADVVLCQHSHCIGSYEKYDESHILYGQGNFHFVKEYDFEGWHSGFLVLLDIDKACDISFVPIVRNKTGTGIILATGREKDKIFEEFEKRKEALKTDLWLRGWNDFCESLRETYLAAIADAYTQVSSEYDNERFAHYLDCEAHTDVWRTLCKTWNHTNEW